MVAHNIYRPPPAKTYFAYFRSDPRLVAVFFQKMKKVCAVQKNERLAFGKLVRVRAIIRRRILQCGNRIFLLKGFRSAHQAHTFEPKYTAQQFAELLRCRYKRTSHFEPPNT